MSGRHRAVRARSRWPLVLAAVTCAAAAAGLVAAPSPPPTELLGVEPATEDERHTALGDARWAQRMYDAAMSGGPQ